MKLRVKREMDTMDRLCIFAPRLALTPKEAALFGLAATSLKTLRDWGVKQVSGFNGLNEGISKRRSLAADIRGRLLDISQFAKAMELEGAIGMPDLYRYPKYSTYESLIATAESFADRAGPMAAQFAEYGLPATFVDDLRAQISAFRGATEGKYSGKADRAAGTAGMEAAAREGMKAVRALRAIMRVRLKNEPALLAAWQDAARVERGGKTSLPKSEPSLVEVRSAPAHEVLDRAALPPLTFPQQAPSVKDIDRELRGRDRFPAQWPLLTTTRIGSASWLAKMKG